MPDLTPEYNQRTVFRARYGRIVFFFARASTSLLFWELLLPALGLRGLSGRTRAKRLRRLAVRFRSLAVRLGGVLIKIGQFLSARLDVLPEEITSELAGLQDEVPAVAFAAVRRLAEAELAAPLAERFESVDETPLAAASLGQVHRARLRPAPPSGAEAGAAAPPPAVVIKIQRPDIERIIATDLAALFTVGRWLHHVPAIRLRADIPALLREFARILHQEIDYIAEGKNAETFAEQFRRDSGLRVPRVIWSHTTRRVLTLEDVYGIKVTDRAALDAAGIAPGEVAARLFDTYSQQIFHHGFFHGDPHPGNLFVAAVGGGRWQLTFVDFGMTGRLTPETRAGLREAAIAVGTKDAARLVRAWQRLGGLLPSADVALLERAEARMLERMWGRSMGELARLGPQEAREMLREFRELFYAMPFQIPQDLILLGRTMGILSGICTGLDPSFNAWNRIAPFAQELLAEEGREHWKGWLSGVGGLLRALVDVPRQTENALARLERGELAVRLPELTVQVSLLELTLRRLVAALLFSAFLAGVLLLDPACRLWPARLLLAGAAVSLGWLVLARRHE